jgi:hypothetical protein
MAAKLTYPILSTSNEREIFYKDRPIEEILEILEEREKALLLYEYGIDNDETQPTYEELRIELSELKDNLDEDLIRQEYLDLEKRYDKLVGLKKLLKNLLPHLDAKGKALLLNTLKGEYNA